MVTPQTPEDQLLGEILRRTETSSLRPASREHLDDETLALFAEGLLPLRERPAVIDHLADCSECRQLVAVIWKSEPAVGEASAPQQTIRIADPTEFSHQLSSNRRRPSVRRAMSLSVAAATMVLVAIGVWWRGTQSNTLAERRVYQRSEQLLAAADFTQARRVLAEARQHGVRSDRLLSLNSQAVRQLRGTLALESSGTLTDFGYDFDGTLARGPSPQPGLHEAEAMLTEAQSEPLELVLNRGHLRLSQNDFEAAVTDFQRATQTAPREPLAWLGLGLAEFGRQKYEAAEAAFRHCLSLARGQVPARINRAMTLEELNRVNDARLEWRLILATSLPDDVRRRIEKHLKALK